MTKRLSEVSLPHACRPVNKDMLSLLNEEACRKIGDHPPLDLRVEGEVEPFERLLFFEGCPLYPKSKLLRLPSFDLILDDKGEEGKMRQLIVLRLELLILRQDQRRGPLALGDIAPGRALRPGSPRTRRASACVGLP